MQLTESSYFSVNMPMLHGVCNVGRLDQMLNDNRGLPIDILAFLGVFFVGQVDKTTCTAMKMRGSLTCSLLAILFESLFPPSVTQVLELLVSQVSRHDRVNHELTEASQFGWARE